MEIIYVEIWAIRSLFFIYILPTHQISLQSCK